MKVLTKHQVWMTAQEFVSFLDRNIADKPPNFGDGDSVLTLLYEAYNDASNMDSDDIKAGFPACFTGKIQRVRRLSYVRNIISVHSVGLFDYSIGIVMKNLCPHLLSARIFHLVSRMNTAPSALRFTTMSGRIRNFFPGSSNRW